MMAFIAQNVIQFAKNLKVVPHGKDIEDRDIYH